MDVFMAIADGVIHEVSPDVIRPFVDPSVNVEAYTKQVTRPTEMAGFRLLVQNTVNLCSMPTIRQFCLLTTILGLRVLSPALTKSTKLVTEMTSDEKQQLLLLWRDLPLEIKNKVFSVMVKLSVSTFQKVAPQEHLEAMGHPVFDTRETISEDYVRDDFRFTMKAPPVQNNTELYLPDVDVVIVGLGLGAGVAAHTLARAGKKCLVLEKGLYYVPEDLHFNELEGFAKLYENGGAISSTNGQVVVLAGATFGGGSTVNWSACLKTPFKVRKEWYDEHKLDWVATEQYDNEMDYVLKQMGALAEHITHSHSNQVMLDGCAKLGYKVKAVPQNNGTHKNHSCGMCYLGCKWGIKQGSLANWLRDAAEHGTEFMDGVLVERIVRNKKGLAIGLECVDTRTGNNFTIRGPKKFVLAGGSLQTPVLLHKSGFRNKHIGRHLKLHPITSLLAYYGADARTDAHYNSIMTTVCLEAEDIDGKAHGAKIETLLRSPMFETSFLPWDSSDKMRQDLLKYQGLSSYIILTRDTLEGTVTFDAKKPETLLLDYTINKFDRDVIQKAILVTMDVCYVEGAKEIIHPYYKCGTFKCDKPKHERDIKDADYQAYRKHVENTKLPMYGLNYGSAHQMATCRMSGKGPRDGACDTKGRLYECDNVYVADASTMPTASGANPMVTTMAFARHVAEGIAAQNAKL